jgi:hypothetical protein
MKKNILGLFSGFVLALTGVTANAEVEQVTTLTVTDPAGVIATLDEFMAAGEAQAQSVTLLRHMLGSSDVGTHTIVAIFDDMETLESSMNRRATSKAWAASQRSLSGRATVNSSLLAIQRQTWGANGWKEGHYLAAVSVMSPEARKWLEAMDELNSDPDVGNPGMVRVVRIRGMPGNYAVLISAPTYAGLINFMEANEQSDAFAKMRSATETRAIGTQYYRVAKVWNP